MKRRNIHGSQQNHVVACQCTISEKVGDFVYIDGDAVGNKFDVRTASCHDSSKMPAVGVIIKKVSSIECFVQISGFVKNVFSGLSPGKVYQVGEDGGIQTTPPLIGSGGYSYIQHIGTAFSSNVLYIDNDKNISIREAN